MSTLTEQLQDIKNPDTLDHFTKSFVERINLLKTYFTDDLNTLICKVRVDACLIKEGERCDYLILILSCEDKSAFFVELKGHDLKKAIAQIDSSLTKVIHQIQDFKIYARIVLNRNPTPDINSSIEIKLKKRLKQQNGKDTGDLIKYKSKVLEESM
jgi:hypothetical protein